eukprot:CAMPEP_0202484998 /NCGR_PEP_ID=MMETSP1361-20130828/3933_1 /ASSEMBLY_ACC=CAM_ASM_000849 /TAXON_ID=210615 /ORGANISM="Staurosira complex sp., Strain CCMP2646" /LENGTH=221 /DNA_ID=CAMNT_0049113783 /DNA_START=427 /DNA_END=1092 /DNA_ORIENTATION=+
MEMGNNEDDRNKDKEKQSTSESETKSNAEGTEAKDDGTEDQVTARCENASPERAIDEELSATNVIRSESNSSRDRLEEYLQTVQPGAIAVKGPDHDEPDERRLTIPKHILAERLHTSVVRATLEDRIDSTRAGEDDVKPGAIAVPGPDSEDGRHVNRVVSPKRVLAERLQHSTEREESRIPRDKSDCEMEDVDETPQTERTSCKGEMADCDRIERQHRADH